MLLLLSVSSLFLLAVGDLPPKEGCPEDVDVEPCACHNAPNTILTCQNIEDVQVLKRVFFNSRRHSFSEVHISTSALPFLPHEIFKNVNVHQLYLENVTLSSVFNVPGRSGFLENLQHLDKLEMIHTRVLRGMPWEILEQLTHLRVLNVYYNSVKTLGKDFRTHATHELKQLTFYETGTRSIEPGTFKDFVNLEKVAIDGCELRWLTRDIFPVPFNVRYLHFNKNKISVIPDDMFTEMPHLQTLGLSHNYIKVVPASAFQGNLAQLEYLLLNGNPLECDCRIKWLVRAKPPALSGTCETPETMKGKEVKDIALDELPCYSHFVAQE